MEIGFLGLGAMGRAMAANLLSAGHRVRVWNRSPGPVGELARLGAEQNLIEPRAFDAAIAKEIAANAALVKAAGIPIQTQ